MRSISPHIAWLAAVALGASPARAAGQQPRTPRIIRSGVCVIASAVWTCGCTATWRS